jgi:prepilin-type N-terminal cleavage/methylation domain-containing protein/prepilin-type processing-associated H-X9-DG protein
MPRIRLAAFSLIELLVVIAVIAILAALLFPVLAQSRERTRMSACISNMQQISYALMVYAQDYDETFPYERFHCPDGVAAGSYCYVWQNAIRPYLKNVEVFACPSNPFSRGVPGQFSRSDQMPLPGDNAEGWEEEPGRRMPISYGLNYCTTTWYPADTPEGRASPPLRQAQLVRPSETILVAENQWAFSISGPGPIWNDSGIYCRLIFVHPGPRLGNFIFYDGHVRSKRWLATLYPFNENNWELAPNPNSNDRSTKVPMGCNINDAPRSPDDKQFKAPECQYYQ